MQSLALYLHAGDLSGVLGDFSLSGTESFAVYNKKLKGARLDYQLPGGGRLTGVLSQIEGISETKTFIGHSAHGEITFSFSLPGRPWLTQPYTKNLSGLYHFQLTAPYIEGFSEVALGFDPSDALKVLLGDYGLGYLFGTIASSPSTELKEGAFTVVSEQSDYLILLQHPYDLLRARLLDYIEAYNAAAGLSGKDKKSYPLNPGTDYEKGFLKALSEFVSITVDGTPYPLSAGERHRFYFLGHTKVKKGSVTVEVSVGGGTFRPITDPDLSAYRVTPFYEEGILEVRFPDDFFSEDKSAMRVSFSYSVSGNAYPLGLSVVPKSEKVYLNGKLLSRDSDYTIDYEVGMVILLVPVKENDTIRIDYERARGGLGSTAEYPRNFYGVSLNFPISDALSIEASLLRAADSPTPLEDPEKARTMPNTHTVSGIVGHVTMPGFTADFTLGYSDNRFPFDDNARINLPNAVNAIATAAGYTFFAHAAGVSVYHDGVWNLYTARDGLSGNRVYGVKAVDDRVFFATASGLTALSLTGDAPLDRVENWRRYSTDDGLPDGAIHSLAVKNGVLWVGTEAGIAAVPIDGMDDPANWQKYTDPGIINLGVIRALAVDGEKVYVGSEHGLFEFDPKEGKLTALPGMRGVRINALLVEDGTLYAASDLGLRAFYQGVGTGWIVFGKPVYTVGLVEGKLWYGEGDGLHSSAGTVLASGLSVTAVGSDQAGGMWIGTRADPDYQLTVLHVHDRTVQSFPSAVTEIDGRDPGRFSDIPAGSHTARGGIARASFTRSLGPLSLSGTFESISPQFTAIGRLGREDKTGWDLIGKADITDNISLSASHSYHLIDLESDHPKREMNNSASVSWNFGPKLLVSLNHGFVDDNQESPGFDSGKFAYGIDLSEKLFSDSLALSLGWKDGTTWARVARRDTRLNLSGTWRPMPRLTLSGSWARSVSFAGQRRTGSETFNQSLTWSHRFSPVNLSTSYKLEMGHTLGSSSFNRSQTGKIELQMDQLPIQDWKVLPVVNAAFNEKGGVFTVGAGGSLNLGYSGFAAAAHYSHELSGPLKPRKQVTDRFSLLLSYSKIPDLRPSLTYTQNRSAVIYQGIAKPTTNRSLIGRLSYRPKNGIRDELSGSVRMSEGQKRTSLTANLTNTFVYPLGKKFSSRFVIDGRYAWNGTRPQLNLSLRGGTDITLSDTWSASVSASYLTGLKSSGGLYNSLLGELTITASF